MTEKQRLKALLQIQKRRQQLERYKVQAKKLAAKAEKAGIESGLLEKFREDFGVNEVIEVEPAKKGIRQ